MYVYTRDQPRSPFSDVDNDIDKAICTHVYMCTQIHGFTVPASQRAP